MKEGKADLMGRSLTTLALLLAIALGAALIVPATVDWGEQRAGLEARIAEVVGGPVELAGPVSVRLLPSPRLTAARVSFEDTDGRLTVESASLHAELALWPLFANRVVVTQVALEGGDLRLDGNPAQMRALADQLAAGMSIGAGDFSYRIEPERLLLGAGEGATIVPQARLESDWAGGDTPVRVSFAQGDMLRADATLRPQADGSWRISARATYGEEGIVMSASGVMPRMRAGAPLGGDFSVTADDARAVLGLDGEGPAFSLRGAFQSAGPQWVAPEAQMTLGTMQAVVELRADTEIDLVLNADLTSPLADLDALGFEMEAVRGFTLAAGLRGAELPLPHWLRLNAGLETSGLVLNGRVVRNLNVDVAVADGVARLAGLNGTFPGGTELSYAPRRDRARGLLVRSDSARSLAGWLGADLSQSPEGTLQGLNLNLAISEEQDPLRLSILNLEVDRGRAEGVVSLAEGGGTVVTLSAMDLNLDAYVPAAGGTFISRLRHYAGLVGARDEAEFNLSGENVHLAGANVARFRFAAQTADGALAIEAAEMVFANGGRLGAEGRWAGDASPFELEVTGENVDPGIFEGLPIAPEAPADLSLNLARASSGTMTIEGNVRTAGLNIDVAGNQVPSDGEESIFRGRMIARGQTQGALAEALGLDVFASRSGAELLDFQWLGPLSGGEVTARLELAGVSLLARGTAADPFADAPRADLTFDFTSRGARDVLRQLGGPDLASLETATITGSGRVRRTEGGWRVTTEDASVNDAPVSLSLAQGRDGMLAGTLALDRLELMTPRDRDGPQPRAAEEGPQLAWSTAPFDLDWMDDARAVLQVTVGTLTVGQIKLDDTAFSLTASEEGIAVDEARSTLADGLLTGSAFFSRDENALVFSADVAGEGAPLGRLAAAAGLPGITGPVTLASQLRTRGRSPFDLVAGLEGRIDVGVTEGRFDTVDLGHLQSALNEVRTRRALRDAASAAVARGETGIVRLEGEIAIMRGVFEFDALAGVAETGPFSLGGALDMRSNIIDLESTFQITDPAAGTAPVIVAFRGAGEGLTTSIDITALQELIGDRLADTPQGLLTEDDLPQDLQELLRDYEASFPDDAATTDNDSAPAQTP